ncbi:hypothetical protein [Streptomyces rishiriensis]|uniref:Uncharacterized protein n=1 Tax=Streptomyces rishiriensis TaxID=68264 RepID=A0ABU0NGM6_STRRH|nr:hypothetical protein [Streptomyces rishiriensis]MDQ0578253.1 hypothetical protein [Streptomyces rishiriensis]
MPIEGVWNDVLVQVDDETVAASGDGPEWTGAVSQRLRCCVCDGSTDGAEDYVLVELTAKFSDARQWLGAHAEHLNSVLAEGFSVEVHDM